MWFFGLTKAIEGDQPKKPSVLGIMFNPRIGDSIRPLGETTSVFVQLIAMVFAMNGLFPKDHPGLTGAPGARLTLSEIFSTAWNGLSFTKEGLPKVLLFFAVTGTMIFAVLSIVTALLAGFMGTAHAVELAGGPPGGGSGFFSPASSDDLAQNLLDYIFKGQPLSHYLAKDGQTIPQTNNIQCAMISALGYYSKAMLIFATFILFYHLVTMVVNTAQEGVAMGKRASQVWAPIRLVFAVGLLVPVGTGAAACSALGVNGAGLNAGQYIVIQMASWGSGLASQTWRTFIETLASEKNKPTMPPKVDTDVVVKDVVLMEACKWVWNYHLCMLGSGTPGWDTAQCENSTSPPIPPNLVNETMIGPGDSDFKQPVADQLSGETVYAYTTKNQISSTHRNLCGQYTIPGPIKTPNGTGISGATIGLTDSSVATAKALAEAHTAMFKEKEGEFKSVGVQIAKLIPRINDGEIPDNKPFTNLSNNYHDQLNERLRGIIDASSNNANSLLQVDTISDLGWAAAGEWLNTIARDQGNIMSAYEDGLPKTIRPDVAQMVSMEGGAGGSSMGVAESTAAYLGKFQAWTDADYASECSSQAAASAGGSAAGGYTTTSTGAEDVENSIKQSPPGKALQNLADTLGGRSKGSLLDQVFSVIDAQAVRSGVWQQANSSACSINGNNPNYFTLGAQLVTANPLQEFSNWGFANLRAAYSLWDDILKLSVLEIQKDIDKQIALFSDQRNVKGGNQQAILDAGLSSKFYGFVASIDGLFANIFFVCGYTVAFVVPLLPFFRFFFSVLTWIVSLLEAVVAVPLIALAHLNPEGEGLPGQSAKAGYFMIFNLFLRPVLTVFGLIAGLVVFYVAIMLLNITYSTAVAGTTASYHFGIATLVRIAYTTMYGATVYVCANNAFKTIGFFSEHAMRWVGQQAYHERMGDGGRAVQGVMGQSQGYLGEKALGVIKLKSGG